MYNTLKIFLIISLFAFGACKTESGKSKGKTARIVEKPFIWEGANVYFLLTDRFNNGDTSNDTNFARDKETGKLRGFEGGDIKGITKKIEEGYFDDLGINAIWFSPLWSRFTAI